MLEAEPVVVLLMLNNEVSLADIVTFEELDLLNVGVLLSNLVTVFDDVAMPTSVCKAEDVFVKDSELVSVAVLGKVAEELKVDDCVSMRVLVTLAVVLELCD